MKKYILTIIGAALLTGAFFIYKNTNDFIDNSVQTEGVVIRLLETSSSSSSKSSITYKPLVRFADKNGTPIEFSSSTSSNPPSYSINEKVEVIYNPKSPNDAKIKSFFSLWGGATILGAIGLIIFIAGIGWIANKMNKKNKQKGLKLNGTKIASDFKNVTKNTSLSVNGNNPFIIVSQWLNPTTSEIHIFKSDNIWFDPTDFIKTEKITVFIDKKKPKKYFMDISFLPKVAK